MDGSLLCASCLGQVRPNQLPVVWAKLFARDSALGELLDGHAVTDGYRANAAGPARHIRDVCTQVLCQLGHASKSTGRKEFAQRHSSSVAISYSTHKPLLFLLFSVLLSNQHMRSIEEIRRNNILVYKNEDGKQWLMPLNPLHEPIREKFHILGTVLGKWEDG